MDFSIGDEVRSKRDPHKIGIIHSSNQGGSHYYHVFWKGTGEITIMHEDDLQHAKSGENPLRCPRKIVCKESERGRKSSDKRGITNQKLRKKKGKRTSIWTVSGGLPTLGKRR